MTDQDLQPTNEYHINRRMALATLATLSSSLLRKMRFGALTSIGIEETLAESTMCIVACWHLLRGDGLSCETQEIVDFVIRHHTSPSGQMRLPTKMLAWNPTNLSNGRTMQTSQSPKRGRDDVS